GGGVAGDPAMTEATCDRRPPRQPSPGPSSACGAPARGSGGFANMPRQKMTLTNPQIVTLAVYLLGGDRSTVDTEDVAVMAKELAPGRFTWRRHKAQINLELIRVYLSDAKKVAHGVLLRGSGNSGWALTARGLAFAKPAAETVDPRQLAQRAIKPSE